MEVVLLAALVCLALVGLASGYPVAFAIGGSAILVSFVGQATGVFDAQVLGLITNRLYGLMTNGLLLAVPLFIFMGVTLERSKIAEELLRTFGLLFGGLRGGMAISVTLVGALLAASTGIVGASVITMGLLSLPAMLRYNYSERLSCGSICAAGTLGQILPPSIVLVILADRVSATYQQSQMEIGNLAPGIVSVLDLFLGAVLPGLIIVVLFVVWQVVYAVMRPGAAPAIPAEEREAFSGPQLALQVGKVLVPPILLIVLVLGSILTGIATPTEGAGVGAAGALVLAAAHRQLTLKTLAEITRGAAQLSCMIFSILIGAAVFVLVFRGLGGAEIVHDLLTGLPGGTNGALISVMIAIFLLGFLLDFIEIIYIVVPIVGSALFKMGVDPVWFAILVAVNLQTSFLTPPFGFALFYLRGVAPASVRTEEIYRGVVPFVIIQLVVVVTVFLFPRLATWLPQAVYG